MNRKLGLLLAICCPLAGFSQQNPFLSSQKRINRDSLLIIANRSPDPLEQIAALRELGQYYYENKRDSALVFFEEQRSLARKTGLKLWEADALVSLGFISYTQSNYPKSLQSLLQARKIAEDPSSEKDNWLRRKTWVDATKARKSILARMHNHFAGLYGFTGNFRDNREKELFHFKQAIPLAQEAGDSTMLTILHMNLTRHYAYGTAMLDSVQYYFRIAMELIGSTGYTRYKGGLMHNMGTAYFRQGRISDAQSYFWEGVRVSMDAANDRNLGENCLSLSEIHRQKGSLDSSLYYARRALQAYSSTLMLAGQANAYAAISTAFKASGKLDSAFFYQSLSLQTQERLDATDKSKKFQQISFDEQMREQEIIEEQKRYRNRLINYALLTGLFILSIAGWVVYRNSLARKKANEQLQKKNHELAIEASLEKVRAQSLAMQKSDQLREVVAIMFRELGRLGFFLEDSAVSVVIFRDSERMMLQWIADPEHTYATSFDIPFTDHSLSSDIEQSRKAGIGFFSKMYAKEEKNRYFNFLFEQTNYKDLPEEVKRHMLGSEHYGISVVFAKNSGILIPTNSGRLVTVQQRGILERMANVFDQAYTRFLDLQKAEVQAREAQIEVAVERVRAKALAMHRSEEMLGVAATLRQELYDLNLPGIMAVSIMLDQGNGNIRLWDITVAAGVDVDMDSSWDFIFSSASMDPRLFFYQIWNMTERYRIVEQDETEIELFLQWVDSFDPALVVRMREAVNKMNLQKTWYPAIQLQHGRLFCYFISPPPPETGPILLKIGAAFDLAYKRFLDLKNAEAQAREARIEAALEKIRSRSLAMHRSDELEEVVLVVFGKLKELGLEFDGAGINLFREDSKDSVLWVFSPAFMTTATPINLPYVEEVYSSNPIARDIWNARTTDQKIIDKTYAYEEKNEYFRYVFEHNDHSQIPMEVRTQVLRLSSQTAATVVEKYSSVGIDNWSGKTFPPMVFDLLKRMAKVFDQAYIRYLDLQKSEQRAREAKIEAALERVRARSMAMHKSEELREVAVLLYRELKAQGVANFLNCGFVEVDEKNRIQHGWMTKTDGSLLEGYTIPLVGDPVLDLRYEAWKRKDPVFCQKVGGEALKAHTEFTSPHLGSKEVDDMVRSQFPDPTIYYCGNFSNGYLHVITGTELDEEEQALLARFAHVFELTYKRFLDLKHAEAQAREARIEAALERVRSRAMAMHDSEELREVVATIFGQLQHLGFDILQCVILIVNEQQSDITWWSTGITQDMLPEGYQMPLAMMEHPFARSFCEDWKKGISFRRAELSGELKESWDELLFTQSHLKFMPKEVQDSMRSINQVYLSDAFIRHGALEIAGPAPLSEEEADVLQRFAKVIDFTYTRVDDLQKAEARARDARKQATLDRVRGEIASMRTAEDLQRITPLIWKELTTLGVPFVRCGVFIINPVEATVQALLSSPDGQSLGVLHLGTEENDITRNLVDQWQHHKVYREHWTRAEFIDWMQSMMQQGQLKDFKEYQGAESPPESLHLHFVPFKQGMLYIGNTTPLDAEAIELVQTLAGTFAIAYSRYEDFRQLEDAKNRVETTLKELKATQAQLVQSEKMASLGELTAGIAHEIQNPLNFVNNFSEVNRELISELKDEADQGNLDEVKAIASDILHNEEKIIHHGKRADAIVKSMLQHSRTGSGQKELTDLSALADEYLKLAYHACLSDRQGMRSQDQSFMVTLETEYDRNAGTVETIRQDIGRVLLNLYNNAFYAVMERKKNSWAGYEPKVSVSVKRLINSSSANRQSPCLEIRVKDNGMGIPEEIRDKIFQPFFTTKPTGQGTGLGLSLSYDIIKAHGGELKVETSTGYGSEFIIELPIT